MLIMNDQNSNRFELTATLKQIEIAYFDPRANSVLREFPCFKFAYVKAGSIIG